MVLAERSEARAKGSHKALLQHPHVDLDLSHYARPRLPRGRRAGPAHG
ncbi:MAG: hypothetical protein R3F30_06635 [Planctomycetota bacterium]